jgi:hypothetical protein
MSGYHFPADFEIISLDELENMLSKPSLYS